MMKTSLTRTILTVSVACLAVLASYECFITFHRRKEIKKQLRKVKKKRKQLLGRSRFRNRELPASGLESHATYSADDDDEDYDADTVSLEDEEKDIEIARLEAGKVVDITQREYWRALPYASHVVGGRFVNPFETWQERTSYDFFKWLLTRRPVPITQEDEEVRSVRTVTKPSFELLKTFQSQYTPCPTSSPSQSWELLPPKPKTPKMSFTWLGQSTCYVQLPHANILTDPVFTTRTVGEFIGPKRMRPVPCELDDLPTPDIILVSHDHYDHLGIDVVYQLRTNSQVTWVVPLGLRNWLVRHGVSPLKIVEMDWWQDYWYSDSIKIVCIPTQHWSGRGILDTNTRLWCGFLVISYPSPQRHNNNHSEEPGFSTPSSHSPQASSSCDSTAIPMSFLHLGDTAYHPGFSLVRHIVGDDLLPITQFNRSASFNGSESSHSLPSSSFANPVSQLPRITLAALPVGSFQPRWYMKWVHMSPSESVQVAREVGARVAVGVHWGTWRMSDEAVAEGGKEFVREGNLLRDRRGAERRDDRLVETDADLEDADNLPNCMITDIGKTIVVDALGRIVPLDDLPAST